MESGLDVNRRGNSFLGETHGNIKHTAIHVFWEELLYQRCIEIAP